MAKKSGKGEHASAEDVGAEVANEPMNLPPTPDEDAFDREQEEVAAKVRAREDEISREAAPATDDMLGRLTAAMEVIAAQPNRSDAMEKAFDRLAAAFERMAENQLIGADRVAKATKVASRPSNEAFPSISVFNLRGDKDFPKPRLKYLILAPYPIEHEMVTREEIELLNIVTPGEYVVRRNDNTKIKITIRATYKLDSDDMDKVLINHDTAFNNDYHQLMPPFSNWLRQILTQNPKTKQAANLVLTMDEEAALIVAGKLNDGTTPENGVVMSVGE